MWLSASAHQAPLALELIVAQTWNALRDGTWPTAGGAMPVVLQEPKLRDYAVKELLR